MDPGTLKTRTIHTTIELLIQHYRALQAAQAKGLPLPTVSAKRLLLQAGRRHRVPRIPRLTDVIAALPGKWRAVLEPFLLAKPVRSASGVAVIAVMCKPHRCPHIAMAGNICVYCPGGPDSDFEYSTQSYTGYEPTSIRAIRARYDPQLQVRHRLDQLRRLGHRADKIEFIVMGGTFMSLPRDYRDYFIRNLHDALSGHQSRDVAEAVRYGALARTKCVGLTIETRPDYCLRPHLSDMLSYGCTRLEVGVQSVYEDVARDTNRGHTVDAVRDCLSMAKDAGFKCIAHMMPNLPNVDPERDLVQFMEFFEDPFFCVDGLKIYPTLVIRGTGLYELWRSGRYASYAPDVLVDLLAQVLALVPPWTRVYRIQRDIPMPHVSSSGVKKGNIRQYVLKRMSKLGLVCRDIRTREVGITMLHDPHYAPDTHGRVELVRRDYVGSGGWETFLSYEDVSQDVLIGMARLRRLGPMTYRPELIPRAPGPSPAPAGPAGSAQPSGLQGPEGSLGQGISMVRELHVYGTAVGVHQTTGPGLFQHRGYGAALIRQAETIAIQEHRAAKLAIISGVGTRGYYRNLGYHVDGVYVSRDLRTPMHPANPPRPALETQSRTVPESRVQQHSTEIHPFDALWA